ncbi:hypothetical protein [Vulcanisaeta distributa]|uniref:hypothetical protein n=1 Tax=Vulcanisaeta distributa TaxID=164451 RepID=UPI000B1CE6C8|nr:hypothetical protein [Vulcanisaeta distributa]
MVSDIIKVIARVKANPEFRDSLLSYLKRYLVSVFVLLVVGTLFLIEILRSLGD